MESLTSSSRQAVHAIYHGDCSALEQFCTSFQSLALVLVRRVFPDATGELRHQFAERALQACVDAVPELPERFLHSETLLCGWVGTVCARTLYELRSERQQTLFNQRANELLPQTLPLSPHFDLHVFHRPAESVGGDYYDAVQLDDDTLVSLVADVMGHGPPAALLLSAVKCAFRMSLGYCQCHELLERMNAALSSVLPEGCFVVAGVALVKPRPNKSAYASAGLPTATLVLKSDRCARVLEQHGSPLGVLPEVVFEYTDFDFHPEDSLILVTDGALDICNIEGRRFGETQLVHTLDQAAREGQTLAEFIPHTLTGFSPEDHWPDDVCVLIITAK